MLSQARQSSPFLSQCGFTFKDFSHAPSPFNLAISRGSRMRRLTVLVAKGWSSNCLHGLVQVHMSSYVADLEPEPASCFLDHYSCCCIVLLSIFGLISVGDSRVLLVLQAALCRVGCAGSEDPELGDWGGILALGDSLFWGKCPDFFDLIP